MGGVGKIATNKIALRIKYASDQEIPEIMTKTEKLRRHGIITNISEIIIVTVSKRVC